MLYSHMQATENMSCYQEHSVLCIVPPSYIQAKKKLEKLYIHPLYMYTVTQHYCAGLIRPTQ